MNILKTTVYYSTVDQFYTLTFTTTPSAGPLENHRLPALFDGITEHTTTMTTNVHLGMSAALGAVDGNTSNLDKWKKAELVDMVRGLAFFIRNLPQGAELFRSAAKLIKASPSQGGGFDNTRTALGMAFTVSGDAPIWTSFGAAALDFPSGKVCHNPASQGEDGGTNDNSGNDAMISEDPGGNDSPPASGHSTSCVGTSTANVRPKACRTAYSGFRCQDNACTCWHPPVYCHNSSCYPRRQSGCTEWHPRMWSRAAQGNGPRGGQSHPTTKHSNKPGNTNGKKHAKKNSISTVKKLESELTRTRAELSSQRVMGKTFRDALLASQVPRSHPQGKVHTTEVKVSPPAAVSVPVLPTELVAVLSTLAKALAVAGIPSQ